MVLVLNQDYSPLTVCTVQRAFLLIFLDKADLVESNKKKELRSISKSFPFPSVVRIRQYASIPYKGVVMSRHNIFRRDGGRCQYCGITKDLTLDHVIPRSKGGKSTWTNLVTACKKCNSIKGDYSLEKAGMHLSKQPIKPTYLSFLKLSHGSYREEWNNYLEPQKTII